MEDLPKALRVILAGVLFESRLEVEKRRYLDARRCRPYEGCSVSFGLTPTGRGASAVGQPYLG